MYRSFSSRSIATNWMLVSLKRLPIVSISDNGKLLQDDTRMKWWFSAGKVSSCTEFPATRFRTHWARLFWSACIKLIQILAVLFLIFSKTQHVFLLASRSFPGRCVCGNNTRHGIDLSVPSTFIVTLIHRFSTYFSGSLDDQATDTLSPSMWDLQATISLQRQPCKSSSTIQALTPLLTHPSSGYLTFIPQSCTYCFTSSTELIFCQISSLLPIIMIKLIYLCCYQQRCVSKCF